MGKEVIKERKCLACGQILPRKSRSDKKTCDDKCRKKYNDCIATVGNTEYKRSEISNEGKELFASLGEITEYVEYAQNLVLFSDTLKTEEDKENYKSKFKLHLVYFLERIKYLAEQKVDEVLGVEITEVQEILDELDDRDNDRNDNLYF
ncbi:hypothetical protein V9L05_07545 [Bernardetia sp. Wsw4-3y2]|uniref:hypothetical protein n=1 Tax=Bernardetia sp. Wsw4-3y2 TaxID=3127471 RepID=UPI0030D3EB3C